MKNEFRKRTRLNLVVDFILNAYSKINGLRRKAFFIVAGLEFYFSGNGCFGLAFCFYPLCKNNLLAVLVRRDAEVFVCKLFQLALLCYFPIQSKQWVFVESKRRGYGNGILWL